MNRIFHQIPPLFFAAFLLLGLWLLPDYGMSPDEAVQRKHGWVAIDYMAEKTGADWERMRPDEYLERYGGRHYGVLYSMFCNWLEYRWGIYDFRSIYLLRHAVVFLLFWLAAVFFYKTLKWRLEGRRWALLGTLLLILCPRIFANAFYNPKDIILLAGYVFSTYTLLRFVATPGIRRALWHGLTSAVVVNTRITGIIIPALTILLVLVELLQHRFHKKVGKKYAVPLAAYLLTMAPLTVLFFPYLWEDTWERFVETFKAMANFEWGSSVLHFGEFIRGDEVPWHYIPDWMLRTIPPFQLLLFGGGVLFLSVRTIKNLRRLRLWNGEKEMADFAHAALFFGPLAAVIILQSTLYNGWRQLYFIYPAMVAVGMPLLVLGWKRLRGMVLRYFAAFLVIAGMGTTMVKMVEIHPHENVYFNALAKGNLTRQFDMDYWGLGYKQALEELARRDTSATRIAIRCANYPCEDNYRFLPKPIRDRFELTWQLEHAEYFLSNFRRPEEFHKFVSGTYPYRNPVFFIKVDGHKTIGVYRVNEPMNR